MSLESNFLCTHESPLIDEMFDWRQVMAKVVKLYCLACRLVNLFDMYFAFFALETENDAKKIFQI